MQKGGGGQPGQQRRVLHRVPAPIAAPAEHVIRPPHAEQQPDRLDAPRRQHPAADGAQPAGIEPAGDHRGDGEGEGHGEAHVAHQQHRRMHQHAGVLQERVQAGAVAGRDAQAVERRRDEVEYQQEEALDAHQRGDDVGHQPGGRTAMREDGDTREEREHQRPIEQRAFLAAVEGRERVLPGHGAAGVLGDVAHAEVVREEGCRQREGGDQQEGRDQQHGAPAAGEQRRLRRSARAKHASARQRVEREEQRQQLRDHAEVGEMHGR